VKARHVDPNDRGSAWIDHRVFNTGPKKTAEDNGTRIPLSFIARLIGNDESELRDPAVKRGYAIDD